MTETDDETRFVAKGPEPGSGGTIGPYQILGWIGKGGMGEVLLARDPRLGRKVAIKRIRAEVSEESRRRFQREARLAASLSHPSIVPVFDLVMVGDHEHLVMELVEGPSLTQWLETPRDLDEKLQVAEQVAAGLAYAHRQGIVHRDLKTENVLLSADHQAKIADFGIARRDGGTLESTVEGGGSTELHTREGALLGTYRSMSPEQARGEPADHRSDLFSFGVLLYEMFTGESPFRAASPLETLFRLTGKRHRPIGELAPGLPAGLVRLVDQLLEKEPALRPRSAQEALQQIKALRGQLAEGQDQTVGREPRASTVAVAPLAAPVPPIAAPGKLLRPRIVLPAAALLAGLGFWLSRTEPQPIYAAVMPPRLEGAAAATEGQLAFTVRSGVLRALSRLPGIRTEAFDQVDQVEASVGAPPSLPQVAAAIGADELVVPTISCTGSDCSLRLDRWRMKDGRSLPGRSLDLPAQDLPLTFRAAQGAATALFPERESAGPGGEDAVFDPGAYTRLLEIRRDLANTRDSNQLEGWLAEMAELRAKHPRFTELALAEVDLAWRCFAEKHDDAFRQRARRVMKETLETSPQEVEAWLKANWLALADTERIEEAEGFLARAEALAPGDLRVADQRALLWERSGRLDEAEKLREESFGRRPTWIRAYHLANLYFHQNRWPETKAVLDRLLAEAPGLGYALSLRAKTELAAGDLQRAAELFEKALARHENLPDRYHLATAYLMLGDGAASARQAEVLLAKAPGHAVYLMALADARDLQDRPVEASAIYRQLLEKLAGEEDGMSLGIRAQAHARLGEKSEALEMLEKAIKKAPVDDGQMAFEAALVHTLLGERESAEHYIRKTIAAGWGRWLSLSPFAKWSDDPEIAALIREAI